MISCPKCQTQVNGKALSCPQCGVQLGKTTRTKFGKIVKWSFILFNVTMLLCMVSFMEPAFEDFENVSPASFILWGMIIWSIMGIWVVGGIILEILTLLSWPKRELDLYANDMRKPKRWIGSPPAQLTWNKTSLINYPKCNKEYSCNVAACPGCANPTPTVNAFFEKTLASSPVPSYARQPDQKKLNLTLQWLSCPKTL